jgi:hypothetical protein
VSKPLKLSLSAVALLGGFTSAGAIAFESIGYKASGMGGAGVANAAGSLAGYYNPALLADTKYDVEVSLGVGITARDSGLGQSADELNDLDFADLIDRASENVIALSPDDKDKLIEAKNIAIDMDGDALQASPRAYLGVQVKNFGIGIYGYSDAVGKAVVDQAHDQLIFENSDAYVQLNDDGSTTPSNQTDYENTSLEYALNNNLTYTDVKGVAIAEVPLSYGHRFETKVGALSVGGSLKFMQGVTYFDQIDLDDSDSSDSSDKNDKTSSNFGIDIGLLYQPVRDLSIGLVGKNLNSPEFESVEGFDDFTVDPMFRAGIAYDLLDSLEIAMDIDLTKNSTFLEDVDSQMIGGGLDFHPFSWLSLRGGLMQNISDDFAGLIYTAGLGIGAKWLQLDLSGQVGNQWGTFDGTDYPKYTNINLALISRW